MEGAWTVCRFKGGIGKKEGGGVFERGTDTPMHTMILEGSCQMLAFISQDNTSTKLFPFMLITQLN